MSLGLSVFICKIKDKRCAGITAILIPPPWQTSLIIYSTLKDPRSRPPDPSPTQRSGQPQLIHLHPSVNLSSLDEMVPEDTVNMAMAGPTTKHLGDYAKAETINHSPEYLDSELLPLLGITGSEALTKSFDLKLSLCLGHVLRHLHPDSSRAGTMFARLSIPAQGPGPSPRHAGPSESYPAGEGDRT